MGVLFGYKIIFQAIGVFLAFKIRKVKIRGLNESREVSAILYITSAILATMIVVSYAFADYIDVEAAVFGFGICTATTVVLALTFGSKVSAIHILGVLQVHLTPELFHPSCNFSKDRRV